MNSSCYCNEKAVYISPRMEMFALFSDALMQMGSTQTNEQMGKEFTFDNEWGQCEENWYDLTKTEEYKTFTDLLEE